MLRFRSFEFFTADNHRSPGLWLIRLALLVSVMLTAGDLANARQQNDRPNWPQWRGPLGTGEAPESSPPISWSETENIRWKARIPGRGHSTPIVWNDAVYLTTAVPVGERFEPVPDNAPGSHDNLPVSQQHAFVAMSLNRSTGDINWQRELHRAVPHEGGHVTASLASASPVTDGQHIVFSFGSFGLYCLDRDGKLIWKRMLGQMSSKHGHGEGASPALFGNTVVVNWDHEGASFLVALDLQTGEERWRRDRDEVTSWASPIIHEVQGKPQVIVAGTGAVRGYDLETGNVLWSCRGLSNNIVATPVASQEVVYVGSSYEIRSMFALRLKGASGDLTGTEHVAWKRASRTPYVPTPLLYRNSIYFLRHYQGILTIAEIAAGEEPTGPFRLAGIRDVYASPVAANGSIFITSRDGVTIVLSQKNMPQVQSLNPLDDQFNASAAIAGDQIFLRGETWLYCIEAKPD